MHADAHHLRRFFALSVEHIERVDQILREVLAVGEACRRGKFHVVRIERIRDDELPGNAAVVHEHRQVKRQIITVIITVVFIATLRNHQAFGVRTVASGVPTVGPKTAGHLLDNLRAACHVLLFALFTDVLIMNPAQAVAGNFVTEFAEGLGCLRVVFQRPSRSKNRQRQITFGELTQDAPDANARAVFIHRLHRQMTRREGLCQCNF